MLFSVIEHVKIKKRLYFVHNSLIILKVFFIFVAYNNSEYLIIIIA